MAVACSPKEQRERPLALGERPAGGALHPSTASPETRRGTRPSVPGRELGCVQGVNTDAKAGPGNSVRLDCSNLCRPIL